MITTIENYKKINESLDPNKIFTPNTQKYTALDIARSLGYTLQEDFGFDQDIDYTDEILEKLTDEICQEYTNVLCDEDNDDYNAEVTIKILKQLGYDINADTTGL